MKYEYLLVFWGGAEETIAKELGITETNHWFDSNEERESFIRKIRKYDSLGLATSKYEGTETRKQTVARLELLHEGKTYKIERNFGYAYPAEAAYYIFEEGNYSCDCNLSRFIADVDPTFPELNCGDEIEYKSFEVVQI